MRAPVGKLLERLRAALPFAFGASSLGNLYRAIDDDTARATVDAAWAAGVRYYDTAPFYGFGLSEVRLGAALRGRPRNDFLVSTKVGRLLVPGQEGETHGFSSPPPFRPVFDYSYDGVMRSFEASLARLQMDRVDILYIHDLGRLTHGESHPRMLAQALEGGFRAMAELRDAGCVAAIGLGVNEIEICRECLGRVDLDLLLVANRYTLLDQSGDAFFHSCKKRGIGVVAAGVFSSGILVTGTRSKFAYHNYAPADAAVRSKVQEIERLCDRHGVSLGAAALQFAAAHPAVTLPIIGAALPEEVEACATMRAGRIPPSFWTALNEAGLLAQGTDLGEIERAIGEDHHAE